MENVLLAAALAALVVAVRPGRMQRPAGGIGLALLAGAVLLLAWHFVGDDFAYRQVWLQSAPELSWWLKLTGLWSADEGTLLLLSLIAGALALRLTRHGKWAAAGGFTLAAVFTAGSLVWSPFAATTDEQLALQPFRGMNAHLTSPWMVVHPPLVFLSFLVIVAPAGAMLGALAVSDPAWRRVSRLWARAGWLLVSAGIAIGMWWAYEDFTYGTLWHWDPVQTATFAAWCYLTAMLHGQSRYRPDGAFAVAHPLLGLAAALSIVLVMAVTRSDELASSHRYVGQTSLPLFGAVAGGLALATVGALAWRLRGGFGFARPNSERRLFLWLVIAVFVLFGGLAHYHLAAAYWSSLRELPRPDTLKPFFETLRNFASGSELAALRSAFAQWDVDNFGLSRALAPAAIALSLAGGYFILPAGRPVRFAATVLTAAAGAAAAVWFQPFALLFDGKGLTSGKTVAIFPWLDALSVTLLFLLAATTLAAMKRWREGPAVMSAPVAVLHAGVVVALLGFLSSTVFDGYWQRMVDLPGALGQPIRFPGGYSVTIGVLESGNRADGMRRSAPEGGFHTVGTVNWSLTRDGRRVDGAAGHTVYRDSRAPVAADTGAVRLMCEMVDYRFARYRSGEEQMIHPLISRGLLRDVQIWLPAVPQASRDAAAAETGTVPVVLKTFPLISLVWIGFFLAIAGAALELRAAARRVSSENAAAGKPAEG